MRHQPAFLSFDQSTNQVNGAVYVQFRHVQCLAAGAELTGDRNDGHPKLLMVWGELNPTILVKPSRVKFIWVSDSGLTSVGDSFIHTGGTEGLNDSICHSNPRATTCCEAAGRFQRPRRSDPTDCRTGCGTAPHDIVSDTHGQNRRSQNISHADFP